jgi:hypothetical protein
MTTQYKPANTEDFVPMTIPIRALAALQRARFATALNGRTAF